MAGQHRRRRGALLTAPRHCPAGTPPGDRALIGQGRYFVNEIVVTGDTVRFISPAAARSIPAADVAEVRRAWYDISRMAPIMIRTASGRKLRAAPRLNGLFDVLFALRQVNPQLSVGDL